MTEKQQAEGTVGKALSVLDTIASIGHPVRLVELLPHTKYPKPTLYRLLQTLTAQSMLAYDPDRQTYSLGVRLVRLAHAAWNQSSLAPIARPHIDALSKKLCTTVHLAQLDNGQALYLDKRNAASPIEMFSQAGKVGPGYCTGVGKVMLAFLETEQQNDALKKQAFHAYTPNTHTSKESLQKELNEIAKSGVAFDNEEHEPGIICIAAPILSAKNRVIGGLSVTSSTRRHSLADLKDLQPDLLSTAKGIGQAAESWYFPDQNNSLKT